MRYSILILALLVSCQSPQPSWTDYKRTYEQTQINER